MKYQKIETLINKKDDWLYEISNSITNPKKLLQFLNLKKYPDNFNTIKSKKFFSFRVPYSFALRMKKNDFKDPLLLQVIPNYQEILNNIAFCNDPVQDKKTLYYQDYYINITIEYYGF